MLDRPDLLELYAQHVDDNVNPDLDALDTAFATGDAPTIEAAWRRFCARHLQPRQIYVGLAHDVLARRVPAATRNAYGLSLPLL